MIIVNHLHDLQWLPNGACLYLLLKCYLCILSILLHITHKAYTALSVTTQYPLCRPLTVKVYSNGVFRQTEGFKCRTEFNSENAGSEIKYFWIAPLPRSLQLFLPRKQKKNVVSLWDPVSLKHIASFVKWRHSRKRPATGMSNTRTVNSCSPDAVTGKMTNATRDTGVCCQGCCEKH